MRDRFATITRARRCSIGRACCTCLCMLGRSRSQSRVRRRRRNGSGCAPPVVWTGGWMSHERRLDTEVAAVASPLAALAWLRR
eukprot:1745467-Prymnesium_polylepis.2